MTTLSIELTDDSYDLGQDLDGCDRKIIAWVEGRKVMIKGGGDESSFLEYFASKLGKLIGLNINEVDVIKNEEEFHLGTRKNIVSVHYWEEDFVDAHSCRSFKLWENVLRRFFDSIIDNDDRNYGNYGTVNNEMFLIDHGLAKANLTFDKNEYETRFKHALETKETFPYVENFINLTEEQIIECAILNVEIPEDSLCDEEFINRCIERVLSCKNYVTELYEEMRVNE